MDELLDNSEEFDKHMKHRIKEIRTRHTQYLDSLKPKTEVYPVKMGSWN